MVMEEEVASVHVWDLKADREICRLPGATASVCFSPDGAYAVTTGGVVVFTKARDDKAVTVWRLPASRKDVNHAAQKAGN